MSKHTPGPWNVFPHAEGDEVLNVISGDPDYSSGTVMATWIAELDCDNMGGDIGENAANARLIAAAPDLLEALMAFPEEPNPYTYRQAHAKARAAIAKATT